MWKLFLVIITIEDYNTIYNSHHFIKARNEKEAIRLARGQIPYRNRTYYCFDAFPVPTL